MVASRFPDGRDAGDIAMTTFNVVRFRIKPGREEEFLAAHRDGKAAWPGLAEGHMIRTGERAYCLIGRWRDAEALKAARPEMIATLDSFRDTLEDLGDGRGVTDAASGESVVDLLR
jgi:quinol monooxygenase YgiN